MAELMAGAHVLVVDDDEPIAAALRRALEYDGFRVTVARDGHAALDAARRHAPDLVVLDLMLPGLGGVEVCERLRAERHDALVLMLTARDGTADRVRGLDAGADDYLVKPFAYEELLARVRALLRRPRRGGAPEPDGRLTFADVTMDPLAHEVRRAGRLIDLTAQEFELLRHFLAHPRHVLSRAQLIDAVWGMPATTASNVVDVYVGYLRTKLESDGGPRLIHTVRGVGYVLRTV
jgi:two-component system, OmpR family, response regulator MprA